jgi:hypothetical protein
MWHSNIGDLYMSTNPFISMINDDKEPARAGQQGAPPPPPPPPQVNVNTADAGRVKLPEFWPHAPGIWFSCAELRFETSDVRSEQLMFAYVADALPYMSLSDWWRTWWRRCRR